MLPVNHMLGHQFKIKSIKKAKTADHVSTVPACSTDAGNGTDKPPC
jgi:hypothetical protein